MTNQKLTRSAKVNKTAALYLRKSSDKQEESIDRQRDALRKYATKNGYKIVNEFVDAGISGINSEEYRPAFKEMYTAAKDKDFRYIIAWDQSRITRSDAMKTMAELQPFRETGVKVVTIDKGLLDWDSIVGVLMAAIEAESNNAYVRKLSRNTADGQRRRAAAGKSNGGKPPIGYVTDENGDWVLGDSQDVTLVKKIFSRYKAGDSLGQIAELVSTADRKRGRAFIRSVLKNRRYTGASVWNQKTTAKLHAVRDGEVTTDFERGDNHPEEWVEVEGAHPAIVTREDFEAVQEQLKRNRGRRTPKDGVGYILLGLISCSTAAAIMSTISDS